MLWFYTEILTWKVDLWIFSLVSLKKKHNKTTSPVKISVYCIYLLCVQCTQWENTICSNSNYIPDELTTFFFNFFSPIMHLNLPITKHFLILLYHVCGMYKSNCNFGAGCSNWAVWAVLRYGFVHCTDILE